MLKINQKASVALSMVLNGLMAVVVTIICVYLPEWLRWLLVVFDKPAELLVPTLVTVYFTAVLAYAAIVLLFVLLNCIRKGEVFTSKTVAILRAISWLFFAAALCYLILGIEFRVFGMLIAFVCAFLGMILRVVKNSFEKAAEIKAENDFTV